jgi:hypothetical protein
MISLLPFTEAQAQATRTWVSGVGDDANPCSRTAPCKTFAGAISKTATNGEINTLDPGGFGGVTITKSITINACTSNMGGVLVSGTNAIVVNAPADARVILRCLDINGLTTSLDAVRILAGKSVKLTDSEIFGFTRNGVAAVNSTPGNKLLLVRNFIHDNGGNAVLVAPPNGGSTTATLRNNDFVQNACGVAATGFGPSAAFAFATNCGTNAPNAQTGVAVVNSFNNLMTDSTFGVLSNGANAFNRIGDNEIIQNNTGIAAINGGSLLSFGGNMLVGNGVNGTTTGPILPLLRRHP